MIDLRSVDQSIQGHVDRRKLNGHRYTMIKAVKLLEKSRLLMLSTPFLTTTLQGLTEGGVQCPDHFAV
jgi:hypothetical protein